jgi:hypothetical protein
MWHSLKRDIKGKASRGPIGTQVGTSSTSVNGIRPQSHWNCCASFTAASAMAIGQKDAGVRIKSGSLPVGITPHRHSSRHQVTSLWKMTANELPSKAKE